jgi:Tubulin-tyrosine ligase family
LLNGFANIIVFYRRSNNLKAFDFANAVSPTFIQLQKHLVDQGWQCLTPANLSKTHFDFPLQVTETLEFKHLLGEFLPADIHPPTFYIDDHNWQQVLHAVPDQTWILKPSLLNNGQHIHLFPNTMAVRQHYATFHRMGGPHVLQAYIEEPHLLKGPERGHKYSLRMFWVLTSRGEAYLYPHGYFNVALKPYEKGNFSQLGSHLTNEHLSHDTYNVVQIPTYQYDLFKPFFPQIKDILQQVLHQLNKRFAALLCPSNAIQFALFGVDFMVDASERVWLIEMNHGPCFPTEDEHPLQQKIYHGFWQALIQELIEPRVFNSKSDLKTFVPCW